MNRSLRIVGWVALWFAILLLGCGCVVVRLSLEGERALAQSDAEFDRGHLRESLLFARRAAALYAPGLGHVRRADARLDAIAVGAESSQRQEIAVLAWQAIRATERQRQWAVGRPTDRARRAERRLAVLLTDDGRHGSLVEQQQFSRRVQADLEASSGQHPTRNLGQVLALCAMSAGMLAVHGGLRRHWPRRRWLWPAIGLVAVGAVAWAILLLLA